MIPTPQNNSERREACRYVVRYAALTAALLVPLLWAFVSLRNMYPVAASTMMMDGRVLERGQNYYILHGEPLTGETIDIAPITLTNALYARTWGMVAATVDNANFRLRSLHPANAAMLQAAGGMENLPRGARLPELLRAWGELYNSKHAAGTPGRLKAIRLDAYRWEGNRYADYDKLIESWRVEL
ncbi:MAG: hypothetical protein LC754_04150 [Acidobacteria bacterium]|nr:hypothetical protein [Acidobacteriota bacterium]